LQKTPSAVRCISATATDSIAGEENGDVLWKGPTDSTWRTVATNPQYLVFEVALDVVDSSVGYYGRGCCGTSNDHVYHSSNRGSSWNLIDPPDQGFSQALAVQPATRALLVAGQGMFYSSPDFGTTWTSLTAPWDSRRIFVLPNASGSIVIGSDHGLHWTDNESATWRDITSSISSNILYGVATSGATILTSSQDFGPFISSNGGRTWSAPTGPLAETGSVAINPVKPSFCYAYTLSGFAVSQDGCSTFQAVVGPTWRYYAPLEQGNLITINPKNPSNVYVAAYDGVWLSTDWGVTLNRLNWPMQQVANIAFDPQDANTIYVSSSSGLYQSLSGGLNWTLLNIPTSSMPVAATVSPVDSNTVLVALFEGAGKKGGGVLRSTDKGQTFVFANRGLGTVNFSFGFDQSAIAFDSTPAPGALPVVALATAGGVFASGDLGASWHNVRYNAVPLAFSSLHWDQSYLWTTTYGQGILRSDRPVTSGMFNRVTNGR
jgi:photosystem II stability/assembly factor-like uncharacterized protein